MVVFMEIVLSLYFYFTEHKTERQEQNSAEEDRAKPEGPGGLIQGRGYHWDGLNIEFLQSGVSVIDSPGRNENEALDNLVKEKLENPLAFVIYVVDGHNLFTKQVGSHDVV